MGEQYKETHDFGTKDSSMKMFLMDYIQCTNCVNCHDLDDPFLMFTMPK